MSLRFAMLPATEAQIREVADMGLQNPEVTCALFLCALKLYVQDRDAGVAALNRLHGPRSLSPYEVQFLRDRLVDKPYLPLAYFEGATPQNNYTPATPYTVHFYPDMRPQDCEAGYLRLYLKTPGADSPRAIKLRQKGNEWFLWEYSGVLSGIRIPAAQDPWA